MKIAQRKARQISCRLLPAVANNRGAEKPWVAYQWKDLRVHNQQELRTFHLKSAIRFLSAMPADANFFGQEESRTIVSPNNGYTVLGTKYRRMR